MNKPDYAHLADHPAHQYAIDILNNQILACKWTKAACKRYIQDLKKGHLRGLYFDIDAAQHRIDFYQFCRHSKGKWANSPEPIQPEPWQQFIKWNIYGWQRTNPEGNCIRRFRVAYLTVARKNGKSTDLATDGLYLTAYDGEPGAQVFTAATKREQALIIHAESTNMVKKSPSLQGDIKTFRNTLLNDESFSKYIPLGEDSKTEDGLNVHGALIDEYHAHPNSGMYDVLRSGMGSREQPLMLVITTAGFEKQCACFTEEEYAKLILSPYVTKQTNPIQDDSYFAIIYTLDKNDDWKDEKNWIKANPNLGVSVFIDDMRDMFTKAVHSPTKQNKFKTKKLNIWTQAMTRWITDKAWEKCNGAIDAEQLAGRTCFGGLDLSTSGDITAYVLNFPPENADEKHQALYRFFIPGDGIKEREERDKVPYSLWIDQGFIIATPGNVVDYDYIESLIREDVEKYDIRELAYDPWNATAITNNLEGETELIEFRQGWKTMSPSTKQYEKMVLAAEINNGNNPVMAWMIGCTEIKSDPAGNIKPIKPERNKTGKRIDGVVADIMAKYRTIISMGEDSMSIYETEEIMMI